MEVEHKRQFLLLRHRDVSRMAFEEIAATRGEAVEEIVMKTTQRTTVRIKHDFVNHVKPHRCFVNQVAFSMPAGAFVLLQWASS